MPLHEKRKRILCVISRGERAQAFVAKKKAPLHPLPIDHLVNHRLVKHRMGRSNITGTLLNTYENIRFHSDWIPHRA